MFDVIIVGGGPAGTSAALILGRCMRKVLLIDSGEPRNAVSRALHGFITQDGISPIDFLAKSIRDISRYETVSLLSGEVINARKENEGFKVTLKDGSAYSSKKLLLATGVIDAIPQIEGIMDFYGTSVHTCPYCDAWELRDRPLAVYGKDERGFNLSLSMTNWTRDLVLLTNGKSNLSSDQRKKLDCYNIGVIETEIKALTGKDGIMEFIHFVEGEKIQRSAMFFNTESFIRSKLLEQLDCEFSNKEGVQTGKYESTTVSGLYVAGNICREVQLVIVAAGEGAEAAFGINTALSHENNEKFFSSL